MAARDHPPIPGFATPPLVGRERELATLRAALAAALAGRGSLVLIGGEAGIGKTALAETLCAEASRQGATVLAGRCFDLAETPPYGPWREVFDCATRTANLLPPDLDGGGVMSQASLFAQVRDGLAALAASRTTVVFLDDLHWADPASLDLLRALGRYLADLPLLILAIYREEALIRRHPLYALLPILVREARAVRVGLGRLGADDLRSLVRRRYRLSATDEDFLAAYLDGRSEGNPFYAGELLRALEESGTLRPTAEDWALGDLAAMGVPTLLRQVIDARVDRLGEDARELLAMAAVIGQEVPLALWSAVAGTTEEVLLGLTERALEARLVVFTNRGMQFTHALVRATLYEVIPPLRRRAWHRRAAESLVRYADPDPDTLAYHFQRAGDDRALPWLMRAGERAKRSYAWLSAADRYEAALALLDRSDGDRTERARLFVVLGWLRRFGDPRRALASLDTAVSMAEEADDSALVGYAQLQRGMVRCYIQDRRRGVRELDTGAALLEALDEGALARFAAWLGLSLADLRAARGNWLCHAALAGEIPVVLAHAEQWASLPVPLLNVGDESSPYPNGWFGLGLALALAGRVDEAIAAIARAEAIIRTVEHHFSLASTYVIQLRLVALPYRADDLPARRDVSAAAVANAALAAGATGDPGTWYDAPLALVEGRWDEGPLARAVQVRAINAQLLIDVLARLQRERGDRVGAWATIAWQLPAGPATAPGDSVYFAALALQCVAADLALDAGDLPGARAWLAAHDRWLAWSGAVLGRAEGHLGWAAYHRAAGDHAAARADAEQALAYATAPRQPLALLAAYRLLGGLDTEEGRHSEAHAHLGAALLLADTCAAPYERALSLLALAELRVATGASADALTALDAARVVFAALRPFGLTPRELEVLRLAADGLTNPQIAIRLSLSRKTIARHMEAILAKLAAPSRAAAARLAVEHHLL